MAGMRIVVALALAVALLAPAGAQAGTYDVVSCRAPGANGGNLAWTPGYGAYPNPDPQPTQFDVVQECPGPRSFLLARSRAVDGVDAFWAHSAYFRFDAPPFTTISTIRLWRHGQSVRADTADGGADEWRVFAQNDDGVLSAEQCVIPVDRGQCDIGAPEPLNGKSVSNASLVTYNLDTTWASWGVVCNPSSFKSCATANGLNYPYASFNLWASIVTIRDDTDPAISALGGLWGDGWRRPGESLGYDASDSAGIRSVHAQVGPASAVAEGNCDFRRPAPCPTRFGGHMNLGAPPPDGPQAAVVTATDAAGNETSASRVVLIDGNAPFVTLRRPLKRTIVARLAERASGFARGQIFVRQRADQPFRPLPTRFVRGALRARLDRGKPARTDVRVFVRDNAGNEANGAPTRLLLTSVRAGNRNLPLRRRSVRARFGRPVTFRGKLRNPRGRAVAGVPVTISAVGDATTPPAQEAATTTSATGRFVMRVAPGTTRRLVLGFSGAGDALAARRTLRLAVPASSTIRASRPRLAGAGDVRFSGRVRRGGPGLIVVLQGHEQGRWRTFADTRTTAGGRWRARYRFSGRPGRYPIRARIRPQRGFPYATGYSRPVVIRVG
jgi:hypothetical protein